MFKKSLIIKNGVVSRFLTLAPYKYYWESKKNKNWHQDTSVRNRVLSDLRRDLQSLKCNSHILVTAQPINLVFRQSYEEGNNGSQTQKYKIAGLYSDSPVKITLLKEQYFHFQIFSQAYSNSFLASIKEQRELKLPDYFKKIYTKLDYNPILLILSVKQTLLQLILILEEKADHNSIQI